MGDCKDCYARPLINRTNKPIARCGPVYTESTNNRYSVSGTATKPVMLLQSIRIDGKQLQDGYAIRLDNTLPKRDPPRPGPRCVGM